MKKDDHEFYGYVKAKLESIHDDIKKQREDFKEHVRENDETFADVYRSLTKAQIKIASITGIIGIIVTLVVYFMTKGG
jgi:t-SNARE complex subunit (syntaxin)